MVRTPPPTIDGDFNPGGARWCTTHLGLGGKGRLECTKQRKKGAGDCHMPAVRGTDACKYHSGIRKDVAMVKGEAVITAWSALGTAAGGRQINPGIAVLAMLQQSWLRANAYGALLKQQVDKDGVDAVEIIDQEGNRDPYASGLIGFRYGAAGKEGTIYVQGEEVRALVELEERERDRVVKYAKTAHDMGISDRLTGLAEKWGDVVVGRMMKVMDGLSLTPEQQALVPALIAAHLSVIDVSEVGGGPE